MINEVPKIEVGDEEKAGVVGDIGDTKDINKNVDAKPRKCCCCSEVKSTLFYSTDRKDIQAFYFNQFGRSPLSISYMFLSLAILDLANEQAGCPKSESGAYEDCGNKVYGMSPSSMLALVAMVGGLASACFMPYAGAVVDFSDHRLGFGKAVSFIYVLVNFMQIFIFPSTWFALAIIQGIFAVASYYANAMVMWSYVSAPSDFELHGVTASGRIWETFGMLGIFIVVGIVQFTSGWDSVGVARFAQGYAVVVGGTSMFLAYKRYGPVKALHTLESGKSLYAAGLRQIWYTIRDLGGTEVALRRFLLAYMFVSAAVAAYVSMSVTYLTQQIGLSSTMVVGFMMVNLITNPIGTIVHRTVARRFGHKKNYIFLLIWWIVISVFFVSVVAGPDQAHLSWLIAVLFGIAFGWYYPSSNGYFSSLVPPDRVTELWGFNMFANVVLSWVPPLVFTIH